MCDLLEFQREIKHLSREQGEYFQTNEINTSFATDFDIPVLLDIYFITNFELFVKFFERSQGKALLAFYCSAMKKLKRFQRKFVKFKTIKNSNNSDQADKKLGILFS